MWMIFLQRSLYLQRFSQLSMSKDWTPFSKKKYQLGLKILLYSSPISQLGFRRLKLILLSWIQWSVMISHAQRNHNVPRNHMCNAQNIIKSKFVWRKKCFVYKKQSRVKNKKNNAQIKQLNVRFTVKMILLSAMSSRNLALHLWINAWSTLRNVSRK